jgi:hypothetical protein
VCCEARARARAHTHTHTHNSRTADMSVGAKSNAATNSVDATQQSNPFALVDVAARVGRTMIIQGEVVKGVGCKVRARAHTHSESLLLRRHSVRFFNGRRKKVDPRGQRAFPGPSLLWSAWPRLFCSQAEASAPTLLNYRGLHHLYRPSLSPHPKGRIMKEVFGKDSTRAGIAPHLGSESVLVDDQRRPTITNLVRLISRGFPG